MSDVQKNGGERKAGGVTGKGFQPGQSGNPGGRPKALKAVEELARQHTEPAILALAEIVGDATQPSAARVSAAQALLDRAWGKPKQSIDAEVNLKADIASLVEAVRKRG